MSNANSFYRNHRPYKDIIEEELKSLTKWKSFELIVPITDVVKLVEYIYGFLTKT